MAPLNPTADAHVTARLGAGPLPEGRLHPPPRCVFGSNSEEPLTSQELPGGPLSCWRTTVPIR